jgi:hypothetical protein
VAARAEAKGAKRNVAATERRRARREVMGEGLPDGIKNMDKR